MELDLLLPTFIVELDVMAALGPTASSAGGPSPWQIAAFWCAASLAVYGAQRLAEYVALSVDHASRKVFESFASMGMGCIFWALDMATYALGTDTPVHEWKLLPALSALVVMTLSCRLTVPVLLRRTRWLPVFLASTGMAAGAMLAHTLLATSYFLVDTEINLLPFGLALAMLASLVALRSWRYQRVRLQAGPSPHANTTPEWLACGGVIVAVQWLLSHSYVHAAQAPAAASPPMDNTPVMLVVCLFACIVTVEQVINIRSDRRRQSLVHRGLSMIRSSGESAAVQSDGRLALIADHLNEMARPECLALHFQPIADLRGGTVHMEALLRLEHPRLGPVNPEQFFLVCELRGRTEQVDRLILLNALDHARDWQGRGHSLAINVNVSPVTLMGAGFADWVSAEIARRRLPSQKIRLELTEHAITASGRHMADCVRELHRVGVHVIMDDFGAGYSSLGVLANLTLAGIKCDRLMLRGVAHDRRRQTLLRHMAAMARELELPVIVEGVETEDELRTVVDCGIDRIQGYLFSRPVPAADVPHWLVHVCPERLRSLTKCLAVRREAGPDADAPGAESLQPS